MNQNERMLNALNEAKIHLRDHIYCPISCVYPPSENDFSYHTTYHYIGVTENHLVCCSVTKEHVYGRENIPLHDVVSVRTEENCWGLKTLHIMFAKHKHISVKVPRGKKGDPTQQENLEGLVAWLQAAIDSDRKGRKVPSFSENEEKCAIRCQYFNALLCGMLFLQYLMAVLMAGSLFADSYKGNTADVSRTLDDLVLIGRVFLVLTLPVVILSLVNRLFFGKKVCTMGKSGLLLPGGIFYKWDRILKATYTQNIVTKRYHAYQASFCYLTVVLKNNTSFEIAHFPLYGLRKIKKYAPDIEVGISKFGWIMVAVSISLPLIIALVITLLMIFA